MKNISTVSDKAVYLLYYFSSDNKLYPKGALDICPIIEDFLKKSIKVSFIIVNEPIEKIFNSYINSFQSFIEWKGEKLLVYPNYFWEEKEIYLLTDDANNILTDESFIEFIKDKKRDENFSFLNNSISIKSEIINHIIDGKKIPIFNKKIRLMNTPLSFIQEKEKDLLEKEDFYILYLTGAEKDVFFYKENIFFKYEKRFFCANLNKKNL